MRVSETRARWPIAIGVVILGATCASQRASAEVPPEAYACPENRQLVNVDAAKSSFRAGQAAFSEGDYALAEAEWRQAYRLDCTAHALLLNLATAYELLGRPEDALHVLMLFNERQPSSAYVPANERRIERLKQERLKRSLSRAPEPCAAVLAAPEPAAPPPPAPVHWATPGMVVALASGAGALTGAALYLEGRLTAGSVAERCTNAGGRCDALADVIAGERARARANAGGWVMGLGLVGTATGLVWHLLSRDTESAEPAQLEWEAALDGDSVAVSARHTF